MINFAFEELPQLRRCRLVSPAPLPACARAGRARRQLPPAASCRQLPAAASCPPFPAVLWSFVASEHRALLGSEPGLQGSFLSSSSSPPSKKSLFLSGGDFTGIQCGWKTAPARLEASPRSRARSPRIVMEFLFRSRDPGKRQVKPSQDIALLEDQLAGDESSDDSEFQIDNEKHRNVDRDSSGVDSSSSSGSTSEADSDDELENLKKELDTKDLLQLAAQVKSEQVEKPAALVCGVCLGQASSDANEIVECDGCGISVHEGCYGIMESGSVGSTVSEASTEPWFCEPCHAGLRDSPSCELCPCIGGIYKETDVGRWIHLVCALYMPGVAFGLPDRLTCITIFEMNYANWGRRSCSLCDEPRMAKTGVTIACDAGMCKSYFHVMCAQIHGLLQEPSYGESDPYLAHCKVHTDKSMIRKRKHAYLTLLIQTKRRQLITDGRYANNPMPVIKGKRDLSTETPDQRILRKLARQQVRFRLDQSKRTPWIPTQKMSRMITTSASAVRKLQRMGEIKGITVDRQQLHEQQVLSVTEAKKKWGVAPALTVEYTAYYIDREKRVEEFKAKLSEQLNSHSQLRSEEAVIRPKFELLNRNSESAMESNVSRRGLAKIFRETLSALVPKVPLPECAALKPLMRAVEIITPNVQAKATMWGQEMSLKTCVLCQKTRDQHLLAHCDTCKLEYHLGCLTPPLTRMPKKSKLYGWQCSECDRESSNEEAISTENEGGQRKRRQAATKAMAKSSRDNSDLEGTGWENSKDWEHINGHSEEDAISEAQRQSLIEGANKKNKEQRKKEKEERREERRKRKELKKQRKEDRKRHQQTEGQPRISSHDESDELEIVEDASGCTVRIKPKSIKLKIKTPTEPPPSNSNGIDGPHNHSLGESPPRKRRKRRSTLKDQDSRTQCDKCGSPGENADLVRCDECKKCYHFGCLIPAVKKSPKVLGYSWHCSECDPSEVDSDWHLDK
eukprot:maker-scaffold116_size340332-snap-gene-0.24 protein:Tk07649 transcript:maker-scaffold116_size340332-snap-gene-0.24-mRNA-1 annotation:"phd finger protein 14-like"